MDHATAPSPPAEPAATPPRGPGPRPHYVALDGCRGIAAVMVALYHFTASSSIYRSGLVHNSALFVDFFFVLSGFVIAANYRDRLARGFGAFRFMALRFGRLYPLHLFVLAVYIATECAAAWTGVHVSGPGRPTFTGPTAPWAIVSNLLLVQALGVHREPTWNTVAWSISTEFWAYAVFAAAAIGLPRRLMPAMIALAAGTAAFLVVQPQLPPVAARWTDFARCLSGFSVGVLVHAWLGAFPAGPAGRARPALMTVLELGATAIAAAFVASASSHHANWLAPLAFAPAVLVFAFEGGALSRVLRHRTCALLGTLSYSIYMIHPYLQTHLLLPAGLWLERATGLALFQWGVEDGAPRRFWGTNRLEGDAFTLAMLAALVGAAWVTYRLIEAPGRRAVRELLASRRGGGDVP